MGDGYRWWTFSVWRSEYGPGVKLGPLTVGHFGSPGRYRCLYVSAFNHPLYDGWARALKRGEF